MITDRTTIDALRHLEAAATSVTYATHLLLTRPELKAAAETAGHIGGSVVRLLRVVNRRAEKLEAGKLINILAFTTQNTCHLDVNEE
jgi:hypothetical protein